MNWLFVIAVWIAHMVFFVLGYLHGKSACNRRIARGIEPIRYPNGVKLMISMGPETLEQMRVDQAWDPDETVN